MKNTDKANFTGSKKKKERNTLYFFCASLSLRHVISPDGGIGRRAGLKHQWGNPCRFDPGSGYK